MLVDAPTSTTRTDIGSEEEVVGEEEEESQVASSWPMAAV
jgi:hypothetical protein